MNNRTLLICLGILAASVAQANQAVTLLDTGTTNSLNGPWTLGFGFTPSSNINVTSLGSFAPSPSYTREIGIWDMSGTLLMEGQVTGAESVVNFFNFTTAITTHTGAGTSLMGGTSYVVGATALNGDGTWSFAPNFTVDSGISYNGISYAAGGSLTFPTVVDTRAVSYFGGNFTFDKGTPTTPSPAAILPFIGGLLGAARRRLK